MTAVALDEDVFYCCKEKELTYGFQCPLILVLIHLRPKTAGTWLTSAGDEDASYCYKKDEDASSSIMLWERGVLLMAVVQYCGRTLVTGQLAWRCTQANISWKSTSMQNFSTWTTLGLFLAALAFLYLTLITHWVSQSVSATLEFRHKEWLLRVQTLQTFEHSDVQTERQKDKKTKK